MRGDEEGDGERKRRKTGIKRERDRKGSYHKENVRKRRRASERDIGRERERNRKIDR